MHITDHDKNEINKLDFSASQMACLILPGTHDSSSLFSPLSSLLKKLKFDEKNAEFEGSLDVKQHRSPPRNKQKKQNEISQHEEQASLIEVKGDELTVKDVTENNDRQVVIFELRTSPSYQKKFLAFIVVFFLLLGVCFLF